jgi:hypothetical protein
MSHSLNGAGRGGPWSKEQLDYIDQSIPTWHDFSLVQHVDYDGRDAKLTRWKKVEVERILKSPLFTNLPPGVSLIILL